MNAFLQTCAIAWVLVLHACGGSTHAEGPSSPPPAAQMDVPVNPLPLSERN